MILVGFCTLHNGPPLWLLLHTFLAFKNAQEGSQSPQQDTGYRGTKQDRIFRTCNRTAFWRCPQFLVGKEKTVVIGFRPDKVQWDFHIITLPLSYRVSIQEPPGMFSTFPSISFGVMLGEIAMRGKADVLYCLKHVCPKF